MGKHHAVPLAVRQKAKRTEWSDAEKAGIVERVLEGMAEGHTLAETVSVVATALEENLTAGLVRRWIVAEEETFVRYQRTKTMLGQAFAEEAILVARESTSGTATTDRTLIETLKWAAAKANPVEYGEKQTVEHQGSQTLSVKIVEDDAPIRNVMALNAGGKDALVSAVVHAPGMAYLPTPKQST
jgi:transposase-like protein